MSRFLSSTGDTGKQLKETTEHSNKHQGLSYFSNILKMEMQLDIVVSPCCHSGGRGRRITEADSGFTVSKGHHSQTLGTNAK